KDQETLDRHASPGPPVRAMGGRGHRLIRIRTIFSMIDIAVRAFCLCPNGLLLILLPLCPQPFRRFLRTCSPPTHTSRELILLAPRHTTDCSIVYNNVLVCWSPFSYNHQGMNSA